MGHLSGKLQGLSTLSKRVLNVVRLGFYYDLSVQPRPRLCECTSTHTILRAVFFWKTTLTQRTHSGISLRTLLVP